MTDEPDLEHKEDANGFYTGKCAFWAEVDKFHVKVKKVELFGAEELEIGGRSTVEEMKMAEGGDHVGKKLEGES